MCSGTHLLVSLRVSLFSASILFKLSPAFSWLQHMSYQTHYQLTLFYSHHYILGLVLLVIELPCRVLLCLYRRKSLQHFNKIIHWIVKPENLQMLNGYFKLMYCAFAHLQLILEHLIHKMHGLQLEELATNYLIKKK